MTVALAYYLPGAVSVLFDLIPLYLQFNPSQIIISIIVVQNTYFDRQFIIISVSVYLFWKLYMRNSFPS